MTAINLLGSDEAELPRERQSGDYLEYIETLFADYMNKLNQVQANDPFSQEIVSSAAYCQPLCDGIKSSLEYYFNGFPNRAYEELKTAIAGVRPFFDLLLPPRDMNDQLQYLYRIRADASFNLSRGEMFHIPFHLRHIIQTQRYSIPGLPCLYMGGSLLVCWEELGRPSLDTLHMVLVRASNNRPVRVVNFGHRPELIAALVENRLNQGSHPPNDVAYVTAQAICWPIIAACSIKVLHSEGAFKPEYIIPQLILQWIRDEKDYDGIRYFSTHIDDYLNDPRTQMNYVFPVQSMNPKGHCANLCDMFHVSETVSWQAQTITHLPGGTTPYTNFDIELIQGQPRNYLTTQLGGVQSGLSLLPVSSLQ